MDRFASSARTRCRSASAASSSRSTRQCETDPCDRTACQAAMRESCALRWSVGGDSGSRGSSRASSPTASRIRVSSSAGTTGPGPDHGSASHLADLLSTSATVLLVSTAIQHQSALDSENRHSRQSGGLAHELDRRSGPIAAFTPSLGHDLFDNRPIKTAWRPCIVRRRSGTSGVTVHRRWKSAKPRVVRADHRSMLRWGHGRLDSCPKTLLVERYHREVPEE
jgi:hypothetical protein